jgi:hypothetical protein
MRKLIMVTALLLFAGMVFGQTLQEGNLVGMHVVKVELKPGATMDQFTDFFNKTIKPAWEKAYKDMKVFAAKGIRGESKDEFGMIVIFKNAAARDRYYDMDGNPNELSAKVMEELAPVTAEAEKIGTWTSTYTDWIVQ